MGCLNILMKLKYTTDEWSLQVMVAYSETINNKDLLVGVIDWLWLELSYYVMSI